MVKCIFCKNNECRSCEKGKCTCVCRTGAKKRIAWGLASTVGGVLGVIGGIACTTATGGLAIPLGSALISGGISAAVNPICNARKGEFNDVGTQLKDIGKHAVVGLATGGIGMGTSLVASSVSQNVAKEMFMRGGLKMTLRAGSGALTSLVCEGRNTSSKSLALGVLNGICGHGTSNVLNIEALASGVERSIGKVVCAGATCAIESTAEMKIEGRNIDCQEVASRFLVSGGGEAVNEVVRNTARKHFKSPPQNKTQEVLVGSKRDILIDVVSEAICEGTNDALSQIATNITGETENEIVVDDEIHDIENPNAVWESNFLSGYKKYMRHAKAFVEETRKRNMWKGRATVVDSKKNRGCPDIIIVNEKHFIEGSGKLLFFSKPLRK